MTTVTAIIENEMRYAFTGEERADLLRAVFDRSHTGWAGSITAWGDSGLSARGNENVSAGHRLRVRTDLERRWGAINFLLHNPEANTWIGWDTFNDELPSDAPALQFGHGPLTFPRSASLPLDTIREATEEYCRTLALPRCVKWQEARYF